MNTPLKLRVGIDASNLRAGGGITHLAELLAAADPGAQGIQEVTVWSGRRTLDRLSPRPWLKLRTDPLLEQNLVARFRWQRSVLPALAGETCDVLFVPGSLFTGRFRPFVTMFQNMLPFDPVERRRYGASMMRLKFELLRVAQLWTFRRADGLIALNAHAKAVLERDLPAARPPITIIPHGIDCAFLRAPRMQRSLETYSTSAPFTFLYVSTVDLYKHQWNIAEAVAVLRREGVPVAVDFIGDAYPPALRRLNATLDRVDPAREFLKYRGPVPHDRLPAAYVAADAFVYASTCENLPNILIEAMASGLPIAASSRAPMDSVLGGAGVVFDPESPASIAEALRSLAFDPVRRGRLAAEAHSRVEHLSWQRCAAETFSFIAATVARDNSQLEIPLGGETGLLPR